ncbi:hypothetical protein AFULGI_00017020 [Archaeoglobus fulgidus DSM 8774]|jgi:hypothetical protein|uniref:Uncharacterized protein n=1 Tax=Archaeoglobus fulgidus DSM 8774 TaxID=1344584 RepID=A0A075WEN8_ARCFL|nr:hypothetical protein [Archaeoglobus fulgidus]AIG98461.1 hypothetical protein AFULGI_00017020 [Archaeoglobus fulgidus DSM 8774]
MAERKAETCTDCTYHEDCLFGRRKECVLISEEEVRAKKSPKKETFQMLR